MCVCWRCSPELAGLFGCCAMEGAGGAWSSPFGGVEGMMGLEGGSWDVPACSSMLLHGFQELDIPAAAAPPPGEPTDRCGGAAGVGPAPPERRKRRRTRTAKNKEESESQRMTHIAVERNRRKQMNEYLAVLRSLMPPSYSQRGDQASIVGGAINFVKELEQLLQSLEAQKRSRQCATDGGGDAAPFASFFTFPQYSMSATAAPAPVKDDDGEAEAWGSKLSAVAEVEVTMVESHANLRLLTRRRPTQLLRLVVGLQGAGHTLLHFSMTSVGHMMFYSFNLRVEDHCQLITSVDEIATAAHKIIEDIQGEQACSF